MTHLRYSLCVFLSFCLVACNEAVPASTVSLSIEIEGEGAGSVTLTVGEQKLRLDKTSTQTVASGARLRLSAAAAEGSMFAGWEGVCAGTDSTCDLTLDADSRVRATFKTDVPTEPSDPSETDPGEPNDPNPDSPEPPNVTLSVAVIGEGYVTNTADAWTCSQRCDYTYPQDSTVTIKARAAEDTTFTGWDGACEGVEGLECRLTLTADLQVAATFDPTPPERYLLNVIRVGTGSGLVSSAPGGIDCGDTCEASFEADQVVTLRAVADENSGFKGWEGCSQVESSSCRINLNENSTVRAEFERIAGEEKTVTIPVRSGSDDAEQYVSGAYVDRTRFAENAVDTKNGDFDLTYDKLTRTEVVAGLRFSQLPVPQGAHIKSAYIQFYSDEDYDRPNTTPTTMLFEVEATVTAETFVHQSVGTISGRVTTGAKPVSWTPELWAFEGKGTETERSADLSHLLQELVDRPDWQENDNAVAFIITGTGYRVATTYEDSDPPSKLVITFID